MQLKAGGLAVDFDSQTLVSSATRRQAADEREVLTLQMPDASVTCGADWRRSCVPPSTRRNGAGP